MAGLLEPGQSLALTIDPPLAPNEQPIAMTPNAGDIVMISATLDRVTIQNPTDRVVAYLVTVVPRLLVQAAMVPWKRVATDLAQAVQNSGLIDRIKGLFGGGGAPVSVPAGSGFDGAPPKAAPKAAGFDDIPPTKKGGW